MKKLFIHFILIFPLFSCSSQIEDISEFLHNDEAFLSYRLHIKNKSFFKTDTIQETYIVYLKKNKHQSPYGYDFKIIGNNNSIFSLNDTLYYFNEKNKKYNISTVFQSNINKLLLPNLTPTIENTSGSVQIDIKKIGLEYIITEKFKDTKEFRNIFKIYTLSIEKKQFTKIITSVDFQNDNQFNEYIFDKFNYSNIIGLENEISHNKKFYIYEANDENNENENRQNKFTVVHNIKGHILGSPEIIDLNHFKDKIIILDFWYMSCYPCIKSIPFLNKLYSSYKDVQILGINSIDNKQNRIESLKKFKQYNNIKYPIFLTKDNLFKINAYPTMIIINKKKEIIFSYSGYDENKKSEVIKIIEKELKKTATNNGYAPGGEPSSVDK